MTFAGATLSRSLSTALACAHHGMPEGCAFWLDTEARDRELGCATADNEFDTAAVMLAAARERTHGPRLILLQLLIEGGDQDPVALRKAAAEIRALAESRAA